MDDINDSCYSRAFQLFHLFWMVDILQFLVYRIWHNINQEEINTIKKRITSGHNESTIAAGIPNNFISPVTTKTLSINNGRET